MEKMCKKMTAKEIIRTKKTLCELIDSIMRDNLEWYKEHIPQKWNETTGDYEPKNDEDYTEDDKATLRAVELIEEALVNLI